MAAAAARARAPEDELRGAAGAGDRLSPRTTRILGAVFVALLVLLAASQLLLPGLAERRLRAELERNGEVRRVEVSALPALRLLTGRADRVEVELGEMRTPQSELADMLARTDRARELDATVAVVRIGPFVARSARLRKRGDRLTGEATLSEAELTAALPGQVALEPVEVTGGELLLEATAPVLGQALRVRARLAAREGALVIAPEGLLGGLATFTVFSDPRVRVLAVGARPATAGFTVTAEAAVR